MLIDGRKKKRNPIHSKKQPTNETVRWVIIYLINPEKTRMRHYFLSWSIEFFDGSTHTHTHTHTQTHTHRVVVDVTVRKRNTVNSNKSCKKNKERKKEKKVKENRRNETEEEVMNRMIWSVQINDCERRQPIHSTTPIAALFQATTNERSYVESLVPGNVSWNSHSLSLSLSLYLYLYLSHHKRKRKIPK